MLSPCMFRRQVAEFGSTMCPGIWGRLSAKTSELSTTVSAGFTLAMADGQAKIVKCMYYCKYSQYVINGAFLAYRAKRYYKHGRTTKGVLALNILRRGVMVGVTIVGMALGSVA